MRHVEYIKYSNTELRIEYDFYPAEPPVMYYSDGSGYPGCGESFEIIKITVVEGGSDVTDLLQDKFEDIEQRIRDEQYDDNNF